MTRTRSIPSSSRNPGTVRRGTLRFSHPDLMEWSWPYTVVRGAQDGPHVALISGVHPAEYPAIESNIRFTRNLDPSRLRGTVVSLPLIDVPAFLPRSPFVCPIDGKNPNRFFPGNPNGTFTEVMDDAIFRAVIDPADVLIDLHGGDMVEALIPFSIYSVSGNDDVDARSVALGRAFGLPYLVASRPQPGGIGGTTAHAAAAAGIPSIIAEAGSSGLLTEPETQMMVDGIGNALRSLGMLDGEVRRISNRSRSSSSPGCDRRWRGCGTRRSKSARRYAKGRTSAASAISTATRWPRSARPTTAWCSSSPVLPPCRTTG